MLISGDEKTAVIYARVSTVRQADDGLPIESQIDRCEDKARALGARVVKRFVDGGISGRRESRPEFQAAIEWCETYGPDYLITWSTSRFTRDRGHAYLYKQKLRRAGVEIAYCSVDINPNEDSGMLLEGVFELLDEWQSNQTSKDTSRSMIRNAKRGYWNGAKPPFGYQTVAAADDPRRKRLQPNPAESWIAQRIFSLRADGIGSRRIAQQLNDQNVLRRGQPWRPNAVQQLLANRACIGQIVFGRKDGRTGARKPESEWIIIDSHEPIIDRDTWDSVRSAVDDAAVGKTSRGGAPRSQHVFTGLLRCGHCGGAMHIENARGRSATYNYYRCRNAQLKDGCDTPRVPAGDLDDWLLAVVATDVFTVENVRSIVHELKQMSDEWQADRAVRRSEQSGQLESVSQRIQSLYDILELQGRDAPNLGDLTRRLRDLNGQREQLEIEISQIDAESRPDTGVSDDEVERIAEALRSIMLETDNVKRLRSFLETFVRAARIDESGVRLQYDQSRLISVGQPTRAVHSVMKMAPRDGLEPPT